MTDCVGPLAHILEEAQKGSFSTKDIVDATGQAINLLGNASSHIAQDCCRKIAEYLNSDVQDFVEDENQFVDAAPMLFGKTLTRWSKNMWMLSRASENLPRVMTKGDTSLQVPSFF